MASAAQQLLGDEPMIAAAVEEAGGAASQISSSLEMVRAWRRKLGSPAEAAAALAALVNRIELRRDGLRLSLKLPMTAEAVRDDQPRADPIITRFLAMRVKRRGVELRLVIEAERTQAPKVDLVLLKAVARARRWFDDLASGRTASISAIAARERVSARYVGRLLRLAFLAPPIVDAIADGRQPPDVTMERLTRRTVLPLDWDAQKRLLASDSARG